MKEKLTKHIDSAKNKYKKHKSKLPAISFAGGFLFDLLMIDNIGSIEVLLQQFIFLVLLFILLLVDLNEEFKFWRGFKVNPKFLRYRVSAIHFILGSLLSGFTIFYFKSASLATSLEFLVVMFALLVINEFPLFQSKGVLTRFALFNFCLLSYVIYVVPIIVSQVGHIVFVASVLWATALQALIIIFLKKKLKVKLSFIKKLSVSVLCLNLLFYGLYLLEVLPPVPLSIKNVGVYHSVQNIDSTYHLKYERPWWAFWQSGAQTFIARPGDKVHVVAQIYSPSLFKETVYFHWLLKDSKGEWQTSDKISIPITGGRESGFRGYGFKSNYTPGDWRVQIETSDGREIGRIGFVIVKKPSRDDREFETDKFR